MQYGHNIVNFTSCSLNYNIYIVNSSLYNSINYLFNSALLPEIICNYIRKKIILP